MKINAHQLHNHLTCDALAPMYIIAGDEQLLMNEAVDTLRHKAQTLGFQDRLRLQYDSSFDWQQLENSLRNRSLLSQKQWIEIHSHIPYKTQGKQWIKRYISSPSFDKLLCLLMPKLALKDLKTDWIQACDQAGVVVTVYSIPQERWPTWIHQRLAQKGFQVNLETCEYIAACYEGHLLAVAQAIDTMSLLYPQGSLTQQQVMAVTHDHSRYQSFALRDALLKGCPTTLLKIIHNLQHNNTPELLVLWTLTQYTRQQLSMTQGLSNHKPLEILLQQQKIWPKHRQLVLKALKRCSQQQLQHALQYQCYLDGAIKQQKSMIWQAFQQLCLYLLGHNIPFLELH